MAHLKSENAEGLLPIEELRKIPKPIKLVRFPEFIKKIDWKLLREQKEVLIDILSNANTKEDYDALNGIVHLIDALQDFACDEMGLTEKEIFNLTPEDDEL